MDESFLQELDSRISNFGTDKLWKKQIGNMVIWFSPIPYSSQLKVNQTLATTDFGLDALQEVKRITLSHSIVGFDDIDLRPYRNELPEFSILSSSVDNNGNAVRKHVNVCLSRYLYEKISGWDTEIVELAFEVFADIMEVNKGDNKKEIEFEAIKAPMDELEELEVRVAELRSELNLPQMVEGQIEEPEEAQDKEELRGEDEEGGPEFDPFELISANQELPNNVSSENTEPVRTIPVPEPTNESTRKMSPIEVAAATRGKKVHHSVPAILGKNEVKAKESSPDRPFTATPSVPSDIIEHPAQRKRVDPPKIDVKSSQQNKNPRFTRPTGR